MLNKGKANRFLAHKANPANVTVFNNNVLLSARFITSRNVKSWFWLRMIHGGWINPNVTLLNIIRMATFIVHRIRKARSGRWGCLYWYGAPNRARRINAAISGAWCFWYRSKLASSVVVIVVVAFVVSVISLPVSGWRPDNALSRQTTSIKPAFTPWPISGGKAWMLSPTNATPLPPDSSQTAKPWLYWQYGNRVCWAKRILWVFF